MKIEDFTCEFERYPAYKDSGVDWLGEIPEGWEVKRIGSEFQERKTKVSDKDYPALSVTKNGVVPQLENAAKTNDGDNRKLVKSGDFVINSRSDRKGSSGIAYQDGSVSLINIVLKPKNINSNFCNYLFKSYSFVEEYYRMGHGIVADLWTTRYDAMKSIVLAVPNMKEQISISNFLDDKCNKIDKLIAQKEKMISLLEERKKILIQNAVTKGLNPDVKMKDSGVEWIGEIPEDWEVWKCFHLCDFLADGTHFSPTSSENGKFKYITAKNIKEYGFDFSNLTYIDQTSHSKIYNRCPVKYGDILYIKDGATAGVAMINNLKEEFSLLSSVALIRPNPRIVITPYLKNYLNSKMIKNNILTKITGGALTRLTLELIANFKIIVPPIKTQKQIVNYINIYSKEVIKSILIQKSEIKKLKEYKSILINDVVTGKVKI